MEKELKDYKTTKEDCQAAIDLTGYVCSRCGGIRTPIETVDNSGDATFWPGCLHCEVFNYGVSQHVYDIAKYLVDKENYVHYSHMDNPNSRKDEWYKQYWRCSQIDGATGIVRDVFRIHELTALSSTELQTK